mmetsp:Transcript_90336/g.292385  ORF Transcript_90336/g.292385 Transcript_90336/m.292385 type:complete len:331 (-) Transcript_90336:198-1190(-)
MGPAMRAAAAAAALCGCCLGPATALQVGGFEASELVPPESQLPNASFQGLHGNVSGRVAFFVTTSGSPQHVSYIRCWHKIMARLPTLQTADIILHDNGGSDVLAFKRMFEMAPNRVVGIHRGKNVGYQQGALKSVDEALQGGWFRGYEWVIRINPDVVIHDEQPLLRMMYNRQKAAVLANCGQSCPAPCRRMKINTDFFAIRPERLSSTAFAGWSKAFNAEMYATGAGFGELIRTGQAMYVIQKQGDAHCRVRQNGLWHWKEDCDFVLGSHHWTEPVELNQRRGAAAGVSILGLRKDGEDGEVLDIDMGDEVLEVDLGQQEQEDPELPEA